MATHSSIVAWRIPLIEKPGSLVAKRQAHKGLGTHAHMYMYVDICTHMDI